MSWRLLMEAKISPHANDDNDDQSRVVPVNRKHYAY